MTEIWAVVFGLAALLAIAVVLQPVAKVLRVPHTVLLAAFGAGLVWLIQWLGIDVGGSELHGAAEAAADGHHGGGPIWKQALGALTGINLTADIILFIFLPALVFESSLSLDLRKLTKDLPVILFLAIAGVLISTIIAGVALSTYSGIALMACLLIGAIISATDPVAVIALFKDLGAPKRLTILVEGESLFNDATAIVVATIILSVLTSGAQPDAGAAILNFFVVFLGGIVIGLLVGWVMTQIMVPFRNQAVSVVSLTLVMPFLAFVVAEHFLHVSGVMAAVVSGLSLGSNGRKVIPPQIFAEIEDVWHQLAFWATALIFILVGTRVPSMLEGHFAEYFDEAIILFLVGTLGRALIVFGFIPVLSGLGLTERVSRAFQAIMVWGGLRGAVSLALALVILNTPGISPEIQSFVGVLVTVFVLATLLLQATTVSTLMKLLGLGELAPVDKAIRDRSLAWARRAVGDELTTMVDQSGDDPKIFEDILSSYEAAAAAAELGAPDDALSDPQWVKLGLTLALGQERQFYLEAYGDGSISPTRRRELLSRLEDALDRLRAVEVSDTDDLTALGEAFDSSVAHTTRFRRALSIQRRFGLVRPLSEALATRFGVLAAMHSVIERQAEEGLSDIVALLPPSARDSFSSLYEQRRRAIARAQSALWRQYPEFAKSVDRRNLIRAGQRLEGLAYQRLSDNGLIGPEVHGDLLASLEAKSGKATVPKLRLAYDPLELIGNVPLFAAASASDRRKIAGRLRTIFVTPGEPIIRRGDPGDGMFFIADGAVDVQLTNGDIIDLGTGEFFGEMALLTGEARTADVVSEGYSTLLKLGKRDFDRLMEKNSALAQQIREIAKSRANGR